MEKTSEAPARPMKYALTFIQPTSGLKIEQDLRDGESFSALFYLTNNRAYIANLLGADIAKVMGMHFHDSTLNSDAVIYLEGDITQAEYERSELNVDQFVHYCMEFLLSLWMVKDHAINLLPAVLRISRPGERTDYRILTFGQNNFDRYGKSEPVMFSREEIRNACEYNQDLIQKLTRSNGSQNAPIAPTQAVTNFEKSSSRLLRFLCLLERGRNMPDLGIKLGLFCSCLECLFSRENTEVTHRVSERAAFLLEDNPSGRKAMYEGVKRAYDLRSTVFHGGIIEEKNLVKLPEVCGETDGVLRRAFTKIILNPDLFQMFTEDEKKLKDFFLNLLFSGSPEGIIL